ncbi:MAG: hypothetical protein R3346_04290 [Candidatus Spechtbacterales bacterium]|nr:hypothetical protein [Candidatus Spechtbacterales bacterium]
MHKTKKHYIIFSHGFGVQKDDRGLFTDIANSLDGIESVMFNYNNINEEENTLTVAPLNVQASKLEEEIEKIKNKEPEAIIDIIAHSQGCLVAAIAEPENIRKTIFLAPPSEPGMEDLMEYFKNKPNSKVDTEGESRLSRRDGSTTIVPKEYWKTLKVLAVPKLYNNLSKKTNLIIVQAADDEVLGFTNFSGVDNVRIETMRANHDFTEKARKGLIEFIKKEIC